MVTADQGLGPVPEGGLLDTPGSVRGRCQGWRPTVELTGFTGSSDCEGGTGGYGDIGPGTDVVVRGGEGQVLGTAQLGDGPSVPMSEVLEEEILDGGCIWSTTVRDVPTGEDFYSISVGERGEQTYSEEELEEREWSVSLELGGA